MIRWSGAPLLYVTVVLLAGCAGETSHATEGGNPDSEALPSVEIEAEVPDMVETLGRLSLEETERVVTVAPWVNLDADGGFLVADGKEAQVRLYTRDGSLRTHFGRRGGGPGEFQLPSSAHRLPSGYVLVGDIMGTLTVFDPAGKGEVVATARPGLAKMYTVTPLSDERVVLAGSRPDDSPGLNRQLHLWDWAREEIVTSFLPIPGDSINRQFAGSYGWVDVAVRGDTVAAVFALSDTVFVFDDSGRSLEKIPIPFSVFERPRPRPQGTRSLAERAAWKREFRRLFDLFWTEDGFLVQAVRQYRSGREWSLLWMDRSGEKIDEQEGVARLLAVAGDTLYFEDPEQLTLNHWVVTRLDRAPTP